MGLDAFVRCNCWDEGRTTPPPVPPEDIILCEGRWELVPAYDDRWWGDPDVVAFQQWRGSDGVCRHGRLEAAREWVSNWSGVGELRRAFASVGAELIPTLVDLLPTPNGGEVDAERSQRALDELPIFRERCRLVSWELFDELTDATLIFAVPAEGRRVLSGGDEPFELWAGPAGIYFVAATPVSGLLDLTLASGGAPFAPADVRPVDEAVFRSAHFELRAEAGCALYRDLASGATFRSTHALGRLRGAAEGELVARGAVRECVEGAEGFEHIVARLETLLRASVATGNPICWC